MSWRIAAGRGHARPALCFGALALTAITDNAALTDLGSLIEGITPASRYMLVAGAVGVVGLLLGTLLPTAIAAAGTGA